MRGPSGKTLSTKQNAMRSVSLARPAERRHIANRTPKREPPWKTARRESEGRSGSSGELWRAHRRVRSPSGHLDIWSIKDSDTKFVQLVNSVPVLRSSTNRICASISLFPPLCLQTLGWDAYFFKNEGLVELIQCYFLNSAAFAAI